MKIQLPEQYKEDITKFLKEYKDLIMGEHDIDVTTKMTIVVICQQRELEPTEYHYRDAERDLCNNPDYQALEKRLNDFYDAVANWGTEHFQTDSWLWNKVFHHEKGYSIGWQKLEIEWVDYFNVEGVTHLDLDKLSDLLSQHGWHALVHRIHDDKLRIAAYQGDWQSEASLVKYLEAHIGEEVTEELTTKDLVKQCRKPDQVTA